MLDTTQNKITFLHVWVNKQGMHLFEEWKKESLLVPRTVYDGLDQETKNKGEKLMPTDEIEGYFTMIERHIVPK